MGVGGGSRGPSPALRVGERASSPRGWTSCSGCGSGSESESESASSSQESATGLGFLEIGFFVLGPVVFFVGRAISGMDTFSPMDRLRRADWSSALGSDMMCEVGIGVAGMNWEKGDF